MFFKRAFALLKETYKDWNEDKAPRLAAALAYYTIFSIAPLLILVISIAGLVTGSNQYVQQQVFAQMRGLLGAGAADAIQGMVNHQLSRPADNILATIIGLVTVILGATGVFGQLQDSLNTIWEVTPKEGQGIMAMIKNRLLNFSMILGVSFILLVSLMVSAMLGAFNGVLQGVLPGSAVLWQGINFIVSLGIIALIFAMIYRYLPDAKIDWADVWIGALVTSLLFNIGKYLIGLYLGNNAVTSAYGAAGSLVVILLWIYYSAQILFIGAEFTQVYARHRGKEIQPSLHARKLTEGERVHQGIPRKPKPMPKMGEQIQEVMVPVTSQPVLHLESPERAAIAERREKIRYTPPKPDVVVPVVLLGAAAGVATLARVTSEVIHAVQKPNYRAHSNGHSKRR